MLTIVALIVSLVLLSLADRVVGRAR